MRTLLCLFLLLLNACENPVTKLERMDNEATRGTISNTIQDNEITALKEKIARLEKRLDTVSNYTDAVGDSHESLRETFNKNVKVDNGRNKALADGMTNVRSRIQWLESRHGVYANQN